MFAKILLIEFFPNNRTPIIEAYMNMKYHFTYRCLAARCFAVWTTGWKTEKQILAAEPKGFHLTTFNNYWPWLYYYNSYIINIYVWDYKHIFFITDDDNCSCHWNHYFGSYHWWVLDFLDIYTLEVVPNLFYFTYDKFLD